MHLEHSWFHPEHVSLKWKLVQELCIKAEGLEGKSTQGELGEPWSVMARAPMAPLGCSARKLELQHSQEKVQEGQGR